MSEAQARENSSSELLNVLLSASDDAIIRTDPDGIILSCNESGARMLGRGAEDLVGMPIRDLLKSELPPAAHDSPTTVGELACTARTGFAQNVVIKARPVQDADGAGSSMLYVLRDISENKALEQKLKETQGFLKRVLDHIPDPIFMKDRQHRWIGGNLAFWDLMGGPEENFLGKSDFDFFPEEEARHFWTVDDRVFAGETVTTEETLTKAGEKTRILETKKASFTSEDHGAFLVGVIYDITHLKRAEEKLREYTERLERSNSELEEFAYIASHDMKEPLRGMASIANFMLEDYAGVLDEKGMKRLKRFTHLCGRPEKLMDDLLHYSRLGHPAQAVKTDPNILISEISNTLETWLKERGGVIRVADRLPELTCDRIRLREVFYNLITNAIKYNDKPEKRVEIGFMNETISAQGAERNVIFVRDNGTGIEARHHQSVFKIFRRLHADEEEGSGVGLAYVKKIVERHGGRIWLDSTPGNGTTFYFTLPDAPG